MRLNVLSPADWKKVLSNEKAIVDMKAFNEEEFQKNIRTCHKEEVAEFTKNYNGNMTIFPETKLLPTYLYCFVAGAYEELVLEETYKVFCFIFRIFLCHYIA